MAPRFALYYAAIFLVVGIQLPFWPAWLKWRGLDAEQITRLAKLPSRQVLLSQLAGALEAPMAQLAAALEGKLQEMAGLLDALHEKRDQGEGAGG